MIAIGAAAALAGCGSDNGDQGLDSAGTGSEADVTVAVDMKNIKFVPKSLTVKAGTTVRWTNSDELLHTVTKTAGPGEEFNSGNVVPGATYEQTFTEPGRVDYVCTLHHGQVGSVRVE